jgi:hypothetical protein
MASIKFRMRETSLTSIQKRKVKGNWRRPLQKMKKDQTKLDLKARKS